MPNLRLPPGSSPLPLSAPRIAPSSGAPPAHALPYSEHLKYIQAGDGTARARMLAALVRSSPLAAPASGHGPGPQAAPAVDSK